MTCWRTRLISDRRAASAIEFALVCVPFTLFLLAIMSLGFHFFLQQALDFATQGAARQVQLGRVPSDYTQADFTNKIFCPLFGQFRLCANLFVDLRPVTDYQQLTVPGISDAPDSAVTVGFSFCPGQPGQLMYMHIVYLSPWFGAALFGSGSTNAIISNVAFANENPGGKTVEPTNGC